MIGRTGTESIATVAGPTWSLLSSDSVASLGFLDPVQPIASVAAAAIVVFVLGALLFLGTALVVRRRLSGPGTTALAAFSVLLGATMVAGAVLVATIAPVNEQGIGFSVLTVVIWAGGIPWLLFALLYTGRGGWITPRRVTVIVVPALGYLLLVLVQADIDPPQLVGTALLAVVNVFALFLAGMYLLGSGFVVQTSYRQGNVPLPISGAFGVVGLLLAAAPLLSFLGLNFGIVWSYLVLGTLTAAAGLVLAGIVLYTDSLDSTAVAAGTAARERAFLDLADTAFVLDDQDRIVELNETALITFGLDRSAVLGEPFVEVVDVPVDTVRPVTGDDEERTPAGVTATSGGDRLSPSGPVGADGGAESLSEMTRMVALDTAEGTRQFDVRVSTLSDRHDRQIGSVVSFRDVTDRELREQRIAIFNRVLRHNLRNKLSIVQSATDVLRKNSEENEQLVTAIDSATDDLLSVGRQAREIEQLLDERAGQRRSVPVESLLESSVSDARAAHPNGIFSISVDPEIADVAVPEVLTYAVEELLENGAKHNDRADPRVEVVASGSEESVTITVTDNGPGIPEQERVAIRADDESPLKHASGLGLWSVRWAVTAVGGEISISEADGGGSVVELTVPSA